MAVWSADRDYGNDRLFMAMHNPGGSPAKHYYAAGQCIATRVDDVPYYVLSDHLGSTTLIADVQGNEVGHVAYDLPPARDRRGARCWRTPSPSP